jgi:hypothetical protein
MTVRHSILISISAAWALALPGTAAAHRTLQLEIEDGHAIVSCGPEETSESACTRDLDCEEEPVPRVCREVDSGSRWCFGPSDLLCCYGDRPDDAQCPLVDGYDVRCVAIPESDEVEVGENVFLCMYDLAGTSVCAERAAIDPVFAVHCHSIEEDGVHVTVSAELGDCDRDGVANVEDETPCGDDVVPVDAGVEIDGGAIEPDAGVVIDAAVKLDGAASFDASSSTRDPRRFVGGGGARCSVTAGSSVHGGGGAGLFVAAALLAFVSIWRRR